MGVVSLFPDSKASVSLELCSSNGKLVCNRAAVTKYQCCFSFLLGCLDILLQVQKDCVSLKLCSDDTVTGLFLSAVQLLGHCDHCPAAEM